MLKFRKVIWRNAVILAINSGLEKNVFGLRRNQNYWNHHCQATSDRHTYRFAFKRIRGIASVKDIGADELSIQVVLWPCRNAEMLIDLENPRFTAGDLFATAVLERGDVASLQGLIDVRCRRARQSLVAGLSIQPNGYTAIDACMGSAWS